MIPKFKTYLEESIWGDLRKKSLGKEERMEDDINLFGPEELCDYLKKTYVSQDLYDIIVDKVSDGISIRLYDVKGHYSYLRLCDFSKDKKIIRLSDLYNKHMAETLKKAFNVNDTDDYYLIKPYDNRDITNSFFIEVLDFLLKTADSLHKPCLKKKLTESVWGDLRKKSLGKEERIEDDINIMDYEELGNYIIKNYNLADEDGLFWSYTKGNASGIGIFIIRLDDNDNLLEYFTVEDDDDSKRVTVYPNIEKLDPNLHNKLKETYKLYDTEDRMGMMSLLGIDPKDGRNVDNKFFIEVLNFIIDNLDSKYRKIIDR